MKKIKLTQGQFALVDDADYDRLNQHKWYAKKDRNGNFYAVQVPIYMARQILGLQDGDSRQADHINRSTLDNCQDNLRICTNQQNQMNRKSVPNSTSQFKGVSWDKATQKWRCQIALNKKKKHLGYWIMEEVAALAYDITATREFGEFAYLNFN